MFLLLAFLFFDELYLKKKRQVNKSCNQANFYCLSYWNLQTFKKPQHFFKIKNNWDVRQPENTKPPTFDHLLRLRGFFLRVFVLAAQHLPLLPQPAQAGLRELHVLLHFVFLHFVTFFGIGSDVVKWCPVVLCKLLKSIKAVQRWLVRRRWINCKMLKGVEVCCCSLFELWLTVFVINFIFGWFI